MTIALAPLVTESWICAIWQGVSSFVLQARVVSSIWSGLSVAYFFAPASIASQKPPVAFVIRVTLILLFGASVLPPPPLGLEPPQPATTMVTVATTMTPNAFHR